MANRKQSLFPIVTEVPTGSSLGIWSSSINYQITYDNFLAGLGVTGSIEQAGNVSTVPVLDIDGTVNKIRNLEAGDGIEIGLTAENGIVISVPAVDSEVGTLEQVTANGNVTDHGMVLAADSMIEHKASDGHTHGFSAIGATNVVVINSLDDFPSPVGGEIELVPTPGDQTTYIIGALNIDVSPNVFTVTDGSVVIRGVHRTASRLTTNAAGTMFTCSESEFFQEYVAFDCPNAMWLDFAATAPFLTMANQNVILLNCTSIATMAGAFSTSLRTMTVVSTSVGGILWTGSAGSQINMSNFLGLAWAGTLLDLGTATFDQINIVGNNRFISPVGTVILSGLVDNGNFNDISGRGIIEGNVFNGLGTPLVGITSNDIQWGFIGNAGVPKSKIDADVELTSQLVTITVQGTYYAVGGASWTSDISNRFTVDAAGIMTYIGLRTIDVLIIATSTLDKAGGGSDLICSKIAIDTGSGFNVIDKTIGCTQSTTPAQITSQALISMDSGDAIQLFVANTGSTSDITVSDSSVSVVST